MDTRIYREAVRVIIVKGDQVLLGREAYDENPKGKSNCFDFPGVVLKKVRPLKKQPSGNVWKKSVSVSLIPVR